MSVIASVLADMRREDRKRAIVHRAVDLLDKAGARPTRYNVKVAVAAATFEYEVLRGSSTPGPVVGFVRSHTEA